MGVKQRDHVIAVSSLLVAFACSARDAARSQIARSGMISVWPDTATIAQGDSLRFRVLYRARDNFLLDSAVVTWATSDSNVARVTNGVVIAGHRGMATIVASSGTTLGFAHVTVMSAKPIELREAK